MSDDKNPPPAGNQQKDQQERGGQIEPFTVEFSDADCRNFTITCPPFMGIDIRGRWDISKLATRPQGMRDLGTAGNRIPSPMPGLQMRVDVRRRQVTLFDPLETTEEGRAALKRYNAAAKEIPALRKDCAPHPTVTHELDVDQMKTLIYDLIRKKESKCLIEIDGTIPTAKQVERCPGEELYDPGNTGDDKPRYKKDLQAFKDRNRVA